MRFPIAICCVVLACAPSPLRAQADLDEATPVSIPAGSLDDAIAALAKQAGVNVIYAGDLLDGRATGGLNATLSRRDAFAHLLQGTSLVLFEERGGLRLARAENATAENDRPSTTEVDAGLSPTASECHRVLERHDIRRYCGSPTQWADLRQSVGLRCRKQGRGESLCTSAAEWRRLNHTRIKRLTTESREARPLTAALLVDSPPAIEECHRVVHGNAGRRVCGNPAQWQQLRDGTGFTCRNEYTRNELCASESQWKRWELARSPQPVTGNLFHLDEATDSAARNNPTNPGVQFTVSAPVMAAPAPVH